MNQQRRKFLGAGLAVLGLTPLALQAKTTSAIPTDKSWWVVPFSTNFHTFDFMAMIRVTPATADMLGMEEIEELIGKLIKHSGGYNISTLAGITPVSENKFEEARAKADLVVDLTDPKYVYVHKSGWIIFDTRISRAELGLSDEG